MDCVSKERANASVVGVDQRAVLATVTLQLVYLLLAKDVQPMREPKFANASMEPLEETVNNNIAPELHTSTIIKDASKITEEMEITWITRTAHSSSSHRTSLPVIACT